MGPRWLVRLLAEESPPPRPRGARRRHEARSTLALAALLLGYANGDAWRFARRGLEGRSFLALGLFLVGGAASIFGAAFPVVLPSTISPEFSLTVFNASSSGYTLGLMTVVACIGLPLVIAYQSWTYWVFRRRVSSAHIPDAHSFLPAIAAKAMTPRD